MQTKELPKKPLTIEFVKDRMKDNNITNMDLARFTERHRNTIYRWLECPTDRNIAFLNKTIDQIILQRFLEENQDITLQDLVRQIKREG
ncbi:hypothetical protein KD909_15120 (plasmid) [Exiguobacterium sp. PFWT01]|uniref:hypothetical protein n=1 Tax=Exiguobacterium sp. PFWT01 TaxID=2829816 RepID=UPI001BA487E4|nr:hypothetical protein [Exiguobacterium sp. PFWT01]QUP88692.1 hypothetical protein KD909_15120 [Exiguobacterium sp. PFWT01]